MSKEIDLKKYNLRTDLALEAITDEGGIKSVVKKDEEVTITTVFLDQKGSEKIGKPEGIYVTLEFEDITDYDNQEMVKRVFSRQIKEMFQYLNINNDALILIVGLGNEKSTPDSLGPLVADNIIVTNHLYNLNTLSDGFSRVCVLKPGVMGMTGLETSDLIISVVKKIKPDLVIAVDALASQAIDRLNKTIQMTDSGIHPGSGVGNYRKEINKESLGVSVIAIGVPTVVDAVTIVSDTFNYIQKYYSYTLKNKDKAYTKLVSPLSFNYLKDNNLNSNDKEKLLGLVGSLNEKEVKQLIYEVLTPIGYNLMVTPKEVDFVIKKLSIVIGNGLNHALHKNVTKM